MRASLVALSLAGLLFSAGPSLALPAAKGKLLAGRYSASGRVTAPGLTIRYLNVRASVNTFGRVQGSAIRLVAGRGGVVFENSIVRIKGSVRSLRVRGTSFSAPAVVRLSDGAAFTGSFTGLTGNKQRLSRFFLGRLSGNRNSSFALRSL